MVLEVDSLHSLVWPANDLNYPKYSRIGKEEDRMLQLKRDRIYLCTCMYKYAFLRAHCCRNLFLSFFCSFFCSRYRVLFFPRGNRRVQDIL